MEVEPIRDMNKVKAMYKWLNENYTPREGVNMACPLCECKETYAYYEYDIFGETDLERCANCAHIFYSEDALDEDDESEI